MIQSGRIIPLHAVLLAAVLPLAVSCGIRLPELPAHAPRIVTRPLPPAGQAPRDPDVMIWLIADKLHTGLVFPYDWLLESGFVPPENFGRPRYVTLSWGNRTAYVERGLHSPGKFVRALFFPSPSVMELIPADWNVVDVCPHQRIWRKLVPRGNGPSLARFLNECSTPGPGGRPIVIGTSSWGKGVLLESRHSYFVPRICNIWTVQAIEACGGSIHPWLGLTADGVAREAEKPRNGFEQIWPGGGMPPANPNAAGR